MTNPITKQNPRGAGRPPTGEKRQFKVTGLSPEVAEWIDRQTNKSAWLRAILQPEYDRLHQSLLEPIRELVIHRPDLTPEECQNCRNEDWWSSRFSTTSPERKVDRKPINH